MRGCCRAEPFCKFNLRLLIWRKIDIQFIMKTRKNKTGSERTETSPYKYVRKSNADDVLDELIEDMSESNKNLDILIPLSEKLKDYEGNLSGNSFILAGPANSGKNSHILWLSSFLALDRDSLQTHFISIDCRIYQSDSQFLLHLTRELRAFLGETTISKHININETVLNLQGLNKEFEKLRRKELVLVIKYAEMMTGQIRRQRILYNIFEWLNHTDIKKYINVIILTKNITFVDKLEKRIKSRMNLPIIYLPKIRPADVIEVIKRRIEYRIENSARKNAGLLEKIKNAFINNKDLNRVLEEQYQFCPQDITFFLKIMKLIIALNIQTTTYLEEATQAQINSIIAKGFEHHSDFLVDYKNTAKNLFINLSLPDVILLGFIRQRLMNQEGVLNTQITLKKLQRTYNAVLQRKSINELGTAFRYNVKTLEESLMRLTDENFITIAKVENIELNQRSILSQYSPEDLYQFYKHYEKREEGVPSFVQEIYHGSMLIE